MITPKTALGVYSDSGLNNLEISLIETDGLDLYMQPVSLLRPYPAELKDDLYQFILDKDFANTNRMKKLSDKLTEFHVECISDFIDQNKRNYPQIDIIGYSGHTVYHNLTEHVSIALGNTQRIADIFHIPLMSRFIQSDLKAGGCGGPLFCTFYDALTRNMKKPLGILSLGGITTMTYLGPFGEMQAFDVGIGTVLLDHWVFKKTGMEMDFNGQLSERGKIDSRLLECLLKEPYLTQPPPKTVDKNQFTELYKQVIGSSTINGAATLTAFIAKSIKNARSFLIDQPQSWILIGGGINNPTLVRMIKSLVKEPIKTAIELEWDYETLNAQSYAFLAVRSLMGLPISFPETSGVQEPVTGGTLISPVK